MVNNNIENCGNDEIDILIGGDYYWNFGLNESIRINGNLVMLNSRFGYIFSGPVNESNAAPMNFVHATNLSHSKVNGEIVISSSVYDEWNEKVDKFWEIDSLGILPSE